MTLSKSTRTHLIYQFIILTLVLLCMGYYELSTERKYIMFLAFIPIFCCQLAILSCCTEMMPVPRWMTFNESSSRSTFRKAYHLSTSSLANNGSDIKKFQRSNFSHSAGRSDFYPELRPFQFCKQRGSFSSFDKTIPSHSSYPKQGLKSMSYVNLSGTGIDLDEKTKENMPNPSSCDPMTENSCDRLPRRKFSPEIRRERSFKARSWRQGSIGTDFCRMTLRTPPTVENCNDSEELDNKSYRHEEPQLEKRFSFPFRQKSLKDKWTELKENPSSSANVPYWQTVGYDLAVKYEARRRKRAISGPARPEDMKDPASAVKTPFQEKDLYRSTEIPNEASRMNFPWSKKNIYKSSVARMNKIKAGFSSLIAKNRKDDEAYNHILNVNGDARDKTFSVREKRNSDSDCSQKENCSINVPHLPKFLSKERPFVFYPKYIPFEKDRFESDVRNKMMEFCKA